MLIRRERIRLLIVDYVQIISAPAKDEKERLTKISNALRTLAKETGVPVVAIFGPTNPELQGPVGEQHVIVVNDRLLCLGCNYTSCPIGNPCMEELSVEEVFDAFNRLIQKNTILVPEEKNA